MGQVQCRQFVVGVVDVACATAAGQQPGSDVVRQRGSFGFREVAHVDAAAEAVDLGTPPFTTAADALEVPFCAPGHRPKRHVGPRSLAMAVTGMDIVVASVGVHTVQHTVARIGTMYTMRAGGGGEACHGCGSGGRVGTFVTKATDGFRRCVVAAFDACQHTSSLCSSGPAAVAAVATSQTVIPSTVTIPVAVVAVMVVIIIFNARCDSRRGCGCCGSDVVVVCVHSLLQRARARARSGGTVAHRGQHHGGLTFTRRAGGGVIEALRLRDARVPVVVRGLVDATTTLSPRLPGSGSGSGARLGAASCVVSWDGCSVALVQRAGGPNTSRPTAAYTTTTTLPPHTAGHRAGKTQLGGGGVSHCVTKSRNSTHARDTHPQCRLMRCEPTLRCCHMRCNLRQPQRCHRNTDCCAWHHKAHAAVAGRTGANRSTASEQR